MDNNSLDFFEFEKFGIKENFSTGRNIGKASDIVDSLANKKAIKSVSNVDVDIGDGRKAAEAAEKAAKKAEIKKWRKKLKQDELFNDALLVDKNFSKSVRKKLENVKNDDDFNKLKNEIQLEAKKINKDIDNSIEAKERLFKVMDLNHPKLYGSDWFKSTKGITDIDDFKKALNDMTKLVGGMDKKLIVALKKGYFIDDIRFKRIDDLLDIELRNFDMDGKRIQTSIKNISDNDVEADFKRLNELWKKDEVYRMRDNTGIRGLRKLTPSILVILFIIGGPLAIGLLTEGFTADTHNSPAPAPAPGPAATSSTSSTSPSPSPSTTATNNLTILELNEKMEELIDKLRNKDKVSELEDEVFKDKVQDMINRMGEEQQNKILNTLNKNILDAEPSEFAKFNATLVGDEVKRLKQYVYTKAYYDKLSDDDKKKFVELSEENTKILLKEHYAKVRKEMEDSRKEMIKKFSDQNKKTKTFFEKYLIVIIIVFVMILALVGFLVFKPKKVDYVLI